MWRASRRPPALHHRPLRRPQLAWWPAAARPCRSPGPTNPSRSWVWRVAFPARPTQASSGATCATVSVAPVKSRPSAGTCTVITIPIQPNPAKAPRSGAASWPTSTSSIRHFSRCRASRQSAPTPSSACSSRRHGTRWKTPAMPLRGSTASAVGSSWGRRRAITSIRWMRRTYCPRSFWATASRCWPRAFPTCSTCVAPRCRSTPPAPPRCWLSTWRARASTAASATWRWPGASLSTPRRAFTP